MEFKHFPTLFLQRRRSTFGIKRNEDSKAQAIFERLFPETKELLNKMMSQDRCSSCKGVYHEATGHRFSEDSVLCGPCTRHYVKWLKGHTNRKWGGVRFYDHAFPPTKT